mmetsp:Transcript_48869/g.91574  ORF Transcript_48869/g.91574 Transcript_48869/m.91574 type:complete len:171 (-) Transcript_48869:793-1305(-)
MTPSCRKLLPRKRRFFAGPVAKSGTSVKAAGGRHCAYHTLSTKHSRPSSQHVGPSQFRPPQGAHTLEQVVGEAVEVDGTVDWDVVPTETVVDCAAVVDAVADAVVDADADDDEVDGEEPSLGRTAMSAQFQNSSPKLPPVLQQLFSQFAQLAKIWGCHAAASHPRAAIPR